MATLDEVKNDSMLRVLKRGYDFIKIELPVVTIKGPTHRLNGKDFPVFEFCFLFPYYYDEKDLEKIGQAFKTLKVRATHGIGNVLRFDFNGKPEGVEVLLNWAKSQCPKVSDECHCMIERNPLEVFANSGDLGQACIYERFGVIMKKEAKGD